MLRRFARSPLALLALTTLLLLACGGANRGVPSAAGQYDIKPGSVAFDGREYSFTWLAADNTLHHARGPDFQLVQDERTFLSVGQGPAVIHLQPDEPVAVQGRDRDGTFSSWWFPFLIGYALGGGPTIYNPAPAPQSGAPHTTPSYRYPPTDTFSRGDSLHGSEATTRPAPPDYRKVQPAPHAVSGQGGGAGGGAAATNRDPGAISGQGGGAGSGSAATNRNPGAVSGQGGGAGDGGAATDRGRSGRDTDAGVTAPPPGGVSSRPGPGAGSSPGGGRSGAGSAPAGGRSGGGRR